MLTLRTCTVHPWLPNWQKALQPSHASGNIGYENHEKWLFIAWTFRDKTMFEMLTKPIVFNFSVNQSGELVHGDGSLVDDLPSNLMG